MTLKDGWYPVSQGYYQLWDSGMFITECSWEFVLEVMKECGDCFTLHLEDGGFEDGKVKK